MSRYLILIILNSPLILVALFNAFVSYKLGRTSKTRFIVKSFFWLFILTTLILTEEIYNFLYNEGLTQTESLSLFDVILITASVLTFHLAGRLHARVEILERRLNDFHQETSILLSASNKQKK